MNSRVTNTQLTRTVLRNLNHNAQAISRAQEQISSGYKVNRPSDDPLAAGRIMGLLATKDSYAQYESNLNSAVAWTNVTDTALSSVNDLVRRARTLALQGANDSNSPDERNKIAKELEGIIDSIKTQGNTTLNGEFVFAGTEVTTPPYQLGASDVYAGNTGQVTREIAPGVQVDVNELGSSLFGDDSSGLLSTLRGIIGHLNSGSAADMDAVRNADIAALDQDLGTLLAGRARIGEKQNRFDFNLTRLGELQQANEQLITTVRDTDYGQATIDYMSRQAIYTAALKTAGAVIQPSLVDFLS